MDANCTKISITEDYELISSFVRKHHVLTLATTDEGTPWCCHCFYAFDPGTAGFVFSSDAQTRHIRNALQNPVVAAAIALETKVVGRIQGIQVSGHLSELDEAASLDKIYYRRFPYALALKTTLWYLRADHIKMTHNQLGFGKKLLWNRPLSPISHD